MILSLEFGRAEVYVHLAIGIVVIEMIYVAILPFQKINKAVEVTPFITTGMLYSEDVGVVLPAASKFGDFQPAILPLQFSDAKFGGFRRRNGFRHGQQECKQDG